MVNIKIVNEFVRVNESYVAFFVLVFGKVPYFVIVFR